LTNCGRTSSEGVSLVFVTFELERDLDEAAQDVRDKINRALPELPDDIEQPTIEKLDPDASPIHDRLGRVEQQLARDDEYADKTLRRQIESVNGVGQVLDRRRAQAPRSTFYLDGDKVARLQPDRRAGRTALKGQNLEVPGGRVEQTDRTLTLRTLGRVQSSADFNNIVVANRDGYPIKISDVGHSEDGVEDELTAGRLNDKPALLLQVRRQSGTNTVGYCQRRQREARRVEEGLPAGYSLDVVRDQSIFILASFHAIREHLMLGSLAGGAGRAALHAERPGDDHLGHRHPDLDHIDLRGNGFRGHHAQRPVNAGTDALGRIVIDDAIVVLENIFATSRRRVRALRGGRIAANP